MNSYSISLSSNSPEYTFVNDELYMEDFTSLTLNLSAIDESLTPLYLKIDWGDGVLDVFDNELYKNYRESSIFPELLAGKFSSLLQNTYTHEYYPSSNSLYKSVSAQILLEYCDGSINWFILPLKIRTYDYFESIYDIKLVNTNILPESGNPKEHQFITSKDGFVIESRNDP